MTLADNNDVLLFGIGQGRCRQWHQLAACGADVGCGAAMIAAHVLLLRRGGGLLSADHLVYCEVLILVVLEVVGGRWGGVDGERFCGLRRGWYH